MNVPKVESSHTGSLIEQALGPIVAQIANLQNEMKFTRARDATVTPTGLYGPVGRNEIANQLVAEAPIRARPTPDALRRIRTIG